ncbi:TIGR04372 family glycosyltransferase [Leptospira kirschneri]|uniref:TIGR04372 family glycosyltransferase n=1 Tax=Leptospira kirschneri TaxID=29507 RepID=UPI0002E168CD|nr:TIGR04372 family glycosyltransferase [Leptospira kirschneri]
MNLKKILNLTFKYINPKVKFWVKRLIYNFELKLNPNSGIIYFKLFNTYYQMKNSMKLNPSWEYFLKKTIEVDPDFFFSNRRIIFNVFLNDSNLELMEKYMQIFEDFQSAYLQKHDLESFDFRFASPYLFSSYNVNSYLDTFIKAMELGLKPKRKILVLIPENEKIANPYMLEMWQKYIRVIRNSKTIELLSNLRKYLQYDIDYSCSLNGKGMYIEHAKVIVQREWEKSNKKPLLELTDEDIKAGWDLLAENGIRKNSWFVSLHVRDSGYLLGKSGDKNDPNLYRNADIDSYAEAIKTIVSRGGYVVRVGDPKMKYMSDKIDGVFDYAHSNIRSNKMDIFLFTQCRFFIATNSGPLLVPCIFNVPVVYTNVLPTIQRPWTKNTLYTPKLLKSNKENRILTLKEILDSDIGKFYNTRQYNKRYISIIDNTAHELNALILEMLNYLDGSLEYTDEDNASQERLGNLYLKYSKYGNNGRMGRDFLKKHFSGQLFI